MAAVVHICACAPALVRSVAEAGGIPAIVEMAAAGKRFARADAVMALKWLAGEDHAFRREMMTAGAAWALLGMVRQHPDSQLSSRPI